MPPTEYKRSSAPMEVIASAKATDTEPGTVEMFVAVFDEVDFGGDVIRKGAFEKALAGWAEKGDPIPFIWSHRWSDPYAHVGIVTEAAEREIGGKSGLWVRAKMDTDRPFAEQVHHLLKGRRVTQASFAYNVIEAKSITVDGKEARELLELDLLEVGPTLLGMNEETELLMVASAERSLARRAARETEEKSDAGEAGDADQGAPGEPDAAAGDAPPTIDPTRAVRLTELLTQPRHGGRTA
jgi:uncharacterized protein